MATTVPKLSSSGAVKIRFSSMDQGTTRWREGTFEILEKDNKVNLCLRFNCGGASKTFQVWITLFNFNLFNNCEVCCFFIVIFMNWHSLLETSVSSIGICLQQSLVYPLLYINVKNPKDSSWWYIFLLGVESLRNDKQILGHRVPGYCAMQAC